MAVNKVVYGGETLIDLTNLTVAANTLDEGVTAVDASGAMITGTGSAGLNFKVVGGTTKPSSPSVNTIWVNTSSAITGYVFSPTEPTGSTGLVWIQTDTGDISFNALKKNAIILYPNQCKQYIDGKWVSLNAFIYQSGSFIQFSYEYTYLYKPGDNCSELTGGYTATAMKCAASMGGNANTPTITYNDTNMVLYNYGTYASGLVRTVNKIDFAPYKKIRVKGTATVADGGQKTFHIWTSIGSYTNSNLVAEVWLEDTVDITVDISSLNSSYYVGFEVVSAHYQACTITITEMWMEE